MAEDLDKIPKDVVDCAMKIHMDLGPGLLELAPVHGKQLLTYLKLKDFRLGLLINFGEALLKNGIRRVAN